MGINKIVYGGVTKLDISNDTVTPETLLEGYTAHDNTGALIVGIASGGGEVPIWQGSDDYVYLSDTVAAPVEIYMDDNGYVVLDLPPAVLNLQTKSRTYTPTTSQQTDVITYDNGYDGLEEVDITVNAIQTETRIAYPSESMQTITPTSGKFLNSVTVSEIPSNYVGSGVTRRTASDLQAWDDTVVVPAGYYANEVDKSVGYVSLSTPTATKGTVSNHSVAVTPSITQPSGYTDGGTKTGTAVTVSASELVSGTLNVTSSGTKDVTNYASASVNGMTLPSEASTTRIGTYKGTIQSFSGSEWDDGVKYLNIPAGYNDTAQNYEIYPLVQDSLNVTTNGTYTPSTYDVDGFSSVTVNVSGGEDGDNIPFGSVDLTGTSWQFNTTPSNLPSDESEYYINFKVTGDTANSYHSIDLVDDQYGTMIIYNTSIAYDAGTWYMNREINITGGTDATNKELWNILKANATQTA